MFNWDQYFTLAQFLETRGDEASLRSSVSRVYYSAFHKACLYARSCGQRIPQDARAHGVVKNFLLEQADNVVIGAGIKLDRLRKDRNQCDYDDTISNITALSRSSILSAQSILHDLP